MNNKVKAANNRAKKQYIENYDLKRFRKMKNDVNGQFISTIAQLTRKRKREVSFNNNYTPRENLSRVHKFWEKIFSRTETVFNQNLMD